MQGMTDHQLIEEAQKNFGESGIETLLDALEAYYLSGRPDEESGHVESPTGHFYRVDRWIVTTGSQGFREVDSYYDEAEAHATFEILEEEYFEWADEENEC